MSFVRYSNEAVISGYVMLEQLFLIEHMPYAPENYTKVYLYGLSLACREGSSDNSLERIAKMLSMEITTVLSAYAYWEGQGLVRLIHTHEYPEVEYLPVRSKLERVLKFKPGKYDNFNKQLNAALPERVILHNEFNEYYTLMETLHIEEAALLEIVGYCTRRKGMNIGYPYILTVARNLAAEGKITYDDVHQTLAESELRDPIILKLFKQLGLKRAPDYEDSSLHKKWAIQFGFKEDALIYAAKKCKHKGGMSYLDTVLSGYYERGILSKSEMQDYDANRDSMFALAKSINYYLGVKYEQLNYLVDHFIVEWLALGFEEQSIKTVASQLANVPAAERTWETLNVKLKNLYSEGIISQASMDSYSRQIQQADNLIQALFAEAGVEKAITARDRDSYRTWTYSWGFSEPLLRLAASLSRGKLSPLPYMNSILANWRSQNIYTLESALSRQSEQGVQEGATLSNENADYQQSYSQALANPEFLAIETTIRTLEFELAQNSSPENEAALSSAKAKRSKLLKKLGIKLD